MRDSSMSSASSVPPPTVNPSTKRKHRPGQQRVQIACERCRTRKVKCDGKLPECSSCKRASVPCIIVDRVTYQQRPRSHVEDLESENARLKVRIHQLEQDLVASASNACASNAEHGSMEHATLQTENHSQDIAGSAAHFCPTPESPDAPMQDTNANGFEVSSPGSSRATGSERMFFSSAFQAVLLRGDFEQTHASSEDKHKKKHVRGRTRSDYSQVSASNARPFALPATELASKLQEAYFTHRWPALPLLHRPSFLERHYNAVMTLGHGAGDVSLFLTLMVFALGAMDLKRLDPSFHSQHLEYFSIAMENYLVAMIAAESMETVQGLLLIGIFAINEQQSVNSWHCTGQAVRTAIDIGLHQSSSSTNCDLLTTEMHRRVLWSAYALDRNVSISLGRPCAVRDGDINVPLPQICTDEELMSTAAVTTPASLPSQFRALNPLDMSTFIHIIKLRQIQSKIQDGFYPANISNITNETLANNRQLLRLELDDWIAKAPRYSQPVQATFQTPDWFQIAYFHGLLLLYRPSPAAPLVGREGLQICAESAISMISSYSLLYAKNKITYTWIALHSLFMASVTMLYTLWVSPEIRKSTRETVVKSNVMSCLALFDVMSDYWPLAKRCYDIIDRLGRAAIALFDSSVREPQFPNIAGGSSTTQGHFGQIDAEYMEWFGMRGSSRAPLSSSNVNRFGDDEDQNAAARAMTTSGDCTIPLVDQIDLFTDPNDWFHQGFDMTIPIMTNVFGNEPYFNFNSPRGNETQDMPPI